MSEEMAPPLPDPIGRHRLQLRGRRSLRPRAPINTRNPSIRTVATTLLDTNMLRWALANELRHWTADQLNRVRRSGDLDTILAATHPGQARLGGVDGVRGTRTAGSTEVLAASLHPPQDVANVVERLERMALSGVSPIPLDSPDYPRRLWGIPNPPLVLYVVGTTFDFWRCLAVSGTRTPSQWGVRTAERLGRRLAERGWVVTSGLARGIDTHAHLGALAAPDGRTVAVSAFPLDQISPSANVGLAARIATRGALVSEHSINRGIAKVEFLRRNRIISGLSFAQFIVETSGAGGTRQQAETALEQGRPLFILKPPVSERRSRAGFDALVERGAKPCVSVEAALDAAAAAWSAHA